MPKHGDIIIIHTKRGSRPGLGLIRSGVPLRLDRAKDRGSFRFTDVETGSSCDWPAWSLNTVRWSYAG
jgi:hypothetical protein